jgi:hypothetical protein
LSVKFNNKIDQSRNEIVQKTRQTLDEGISSLKN